MVHARQTGGAQVKAIPRRRLLAGFLALPAAVGFGARASAGDATPVARPVTSPLLDMLRLVPEPSRFDPNLTGTTPPLLAVFADPALQAATFGISRPVSPDDPAASDWLHLWSPLARPYLFSDPDLGHVSEGRRIRYPPGRSEPGSSALPL